MSRPGKGRRTPGRRGRRGPGAEARDTVKDLFRRFHETSGPGRIVFGTDSYDFPWGYITQYADEQVRVMDEPNLSPTTGGRSWRVTPPGFPASACPA
ncbi:hypothetical protein AB0F88_04560 [Streptosporangium sp. NPDC023963]|uniref:hypothetical protein n=1 Tax=Streptosporangium sp. NPDC023963 TaxID=3155608 RepID=UPI003446B4B4